MNLALLADQELAERGVRERLWFEERWYTNRELHDASCRLAGSLRALGIGDDDRVVVLTPNCPEVLISYPAIWRAGAVVVPVLSMLEAHELAYILRNSQAKAIITTADQLAKVRAAQADLALRVIVITEELGDLTAPALRFDSLVERGAPLQG
ncbi:MAG: AMP-dependent synthetase and ligase, partial [Myxococcaceae bacterium]|nr:AMP-dependent synthetase and ligase [Myxococcaceae bacterium]